ncbi:tripartite tricarboxylate transporter substrate binding protein [Desulfosporosinus fructosivorans]
MKKNRILVSIVGIVVILALTLTGCGQKTTTTKEKYPTKPLNMIIAFSAGGSSDIQARIMQKYWNKYVPEQPWVFNYTTGAGGAIGFGAIAKAQPDGYTLGGVNTPHMIIQPMGQGAEFKIDDFQYIAQVVNDPQVLAVHKDSQFKTWQEAIDFAKANPKKLKVGIVGTYTGHHMMLLDLQAKTGIDVTQVVYKGAADQNAAILGKEIDLMVGNVNDVMRSTDNMRILGVAAEKRSEFLPDVPTLKETGLDMVSDIRRAFVVPKATDAEKVKFLRDTFKKIQDDPEYLADMKKAGQPTDYMSGEDFDKYVHDQEAINKALLVKFNLMK